MGICHYRRFLVNDAGRLFSEQEIESLLSRYDLITTKTLTMRYPYYDGFSHNHNLQDLQVAMDVIKAMYPSYYPMLNKMVHKRETWFGNIMICKKSLYDEYCNWLFPIFFEMEKHIDVESYDDYHKRVYGFISEFLLYVFATVNSLNVYQCKVGMLGEKAETKELKNALADYFVKEDFKGAKAYILDALKKRPDVLMEASDLDGELKLAMQVITTCENEYNAMGSCILNREKDFQKLLSGFRRLNDVIEHFRCGNVTKEDIEILKEKSVNGLEFSHIAVEIAILLMCTQDGSVERVNEEVKGFLYGI